MRKLPLLIAFAVGMVSATSAAASPVTSFEFAFELSGHRWGVWVVDGIPSHDLLSTAFREAEWMNNGNKNSRPFYSYVAFGIGQFGAVYLSTGLCFILAIGAALIVTTTIIKRKSGRLKFKTEARRQ
jgi:hypothetical protein